MSSRLYPVYQRGNPQLRVLLPNFWMKMVPSAVTSPPNVVSFQVSPQMTSHDVSQYLQKIYQVPVVKVTVSDRVGRFKREKKKGYIIKEDDIKIAFVTLPNDVEFQFPDLMLEKVKEERSDDMKQLEKVKENYKAQQEQFSHRPGIPTWFN